MSAKKAKTGEQYGRVDASPSKSFFVEMLTRDISLEDAILDLLDNCVDGIVRTKKEKKGDLPYSGFAAEIKFSSTGFKISDNCGGIPWELHNYAFRMGRPKDRPVDTKIATVGVYGIGMKRAMFKMGNQCIIETKNLNSSYKIDISPAWMTAEGWNLQAVPSTHIFPKDGTYVSVTKLHSNVAKQFGTETFEDSLIKKIESHYAIIIGKGFSIKVNGHKVEPKPISFYFADAAGDKKSVRPYVFATAIDGIEMFVTVGLREPVPSADVIEAEQEESRYSRDLAGWTVICNDRVILYCNKDEQTGWGEAGVPKYHNQFRAISGIVEFIATDASKLPTTTTKRGIEHSSAIYAQVKNRMREGTKLFTDYTNDWKKREGEARTHLKGVSRLTFTSLKKKAYAEVKFVSVKTGLIGKQYKPSLPVPVIEDQKRRISFAKEEGDIERVAVYLFKDSAVSPSVVGEECFDRVLRSI